MDIISYVRYMAISELLSVTARVSGTCNLTRIT